MLTKHKLKKCYPVLNILNKLSEGEQSVLLHHLDQDAHEAVYECVYNAITNKNIQPEKRQALRKHLKAKQKDIRYIVQSKAIRRKRKKVVQLGSGLGLILSTVLPLLASFLFNKITKK